MNPAHPPAGLRVRVVQPVQVSDLLDRYYTRHPEREPASTKDAAEDYANPIDRWHHTARPGA